MPISEYFGGHGESVMKSLVKKHGAKLGKKYFYMTLNKQKSKRKGSKVTEKLSQHPSMTKETY